MGIGATIVIGLGAIFALAVVLYYILSIYNGLVMLRNSIKKNWANIDVLLKQRADLIPNLIETVKAYMRYEKGVIRQITDSRAQMMGATSIGGKARANDELSDALKTLFALAENYPQLRANENFLKLQEQLASIENQIADRRELYNDSVNIYNTRIESIPDVIFAKLLGYGKDEYFKATDEEKKEVKVELE
jgi:LemA protein